MIMIIHPFPGGGRFAGSHGLIAHHLMVIQVSWCVGCAESCQIVRAGAVDHAELAQGLDTEIVGTRRSYTQGAIYTLAGQVDAAIAGAQKNFQQRMARMEIR